MTPRNDRTTQRWTYTFRNHTPSEDQNYSQHFEDANEEVGYLLCGDVIRGDFRKPNPWWFRKRDRKLPFGWIQHDVYGTYGPDSWAQSRWEGGFTPAFAVPNFTVLAAEAECSQRTIDIAFNKALGKLYSFLKDSDLAGLVSLGEARELAHFHSEIADSAKQMKSIFAVKGLSRVRSALKAGASVKLLYQFGIAPLLNDIDNLKSFAYDHSLRREIDIKARAWDIVVGPRAHRPGSSEGGDFSKMEECRFRYGGFATVDNIELFLAWRLGLANPVSSAYQLIPMSFIVDWVYNVGALLRNIENAYFTGLSYSDFSQTKTIYATEVLIHRYYYESVDFFGVRQVTTAGVMTDDTVKSFDRILLSDPPLPRSPSLRYDLGSGKILSLAALLTQIFL